MASAENGNSNLRVLIAGGGVAAIETLLALRDLARDHVEVDLLTPQPHFVYRPLGIATAFDLGEPPRFELAPIAAELGATLHRDALASVDADRRVAVTRRGEELSYDVLVVASGAEPEPAVPGAFTFRGAEDAQAYARLLAEIEQGDATKVIFAMPPGANWPLPLYELALLTAGRVAARGADAQLTIVTPEEVPLKLFGREASEAVGKLLASKGIEVRTSTHPGKFSHKSLSLVPQDVIRADHVVGDRKSVV